MGYTRQSVAIGLFFAGLALLKKGRIPSYVLLIVAAGTFHVSAFLLLLLVIFPLIAGRNWKTTGIVAGLVCLIAVLTLPNLISQISGYVGGHHTSRGAVVRGLMTALPALILLLTPRLWAVRDLTIWRPISVFGLLLVPAVFFASTLVDRLGLYLLPLQVFVWGTLPSLNVAKVIQRIAPLAIFAYSGLVLWVWLNFGLNTRCWIPYDCVLFQP